MVESASYTNAYYWYNTDVSLLRDCWERSRTPTLITCTIQTSLVCDCWGWFVHSGLLLVQYSQAWCATVDKASYTHSYYSYNADKPDVRLLRALRTLTLITRTYRQAWCAVVESASYTHAYYSYNTDKSDVRLLRVLFFTLRVITHAIQTSLMCDCWERFVRPRLLLVHYRALSTLTLITRTIQTSLMCHCWECLVHSRLLRVQYRQAWCPIVESA